MHHCDHRLHAPLQVQLYRNSTHTHFTATCFLGWGAGPIFRESHLFLSFLTRGVDQLGPSPFFLCCTSGFGSKALQGEEGSVIRVFTGHDLTFGYRHGRHVCWHTGYRPHLFRYGFDRSPGPNGDQLAPDLSGPSFLA